MDMPRSPGERLKTFRLSRGLSGAAVARGLGRSKGIVSYWESGRSPLPLSACLGLEATFGVSSKWLLEGTEPMWVVREDTPRDAATPGLVLVPVFQASGAFTAAGELIPPPPDAETIGLPQSILGPKQAGDIPAPGQPKAWIRVSDPQMSHSLGEQALVLVDAAPHLRLNIVNHSLYLIRIEPGLSPCVRRVAQVPNSGDIVIATDVREEVPLRLTIPAAKREATILGMVLWILRSPT